MTLKAPGPRASCSSLSWSARYYIAGACKQCGAQRRQHSACSRHCRRRRRRCCSPRSFFLSSLEWLCKCSSRDARWPLPSPHSTVSKDIKSQWNANYMSMNVFFSIKWSGESLFWYFLSCLLPIRRCLLETSINWFYGRYRGIQNYPPNY